MTSALSVGAHVQATRRPYGAGVLSPAVLEEGELGWGHPPGSYSSWTHAGMLLHRVIIPGSC